MGWGLKIYISNEFPGYLNVIILVRHPLYLIKVDILYRILEYQVREKIVPKLQR